MHFEWPNDPAPPRTTTVDPPARLADTRQTTTHDAVRPWSRDVDPSWNDETASLPPHHKRGPNYRACQPANAGHSLTDLDPSWNGQTGLPARKTQGGGGAVGCFKAPPPPSGSLCCEHPDLARRTTIHRGTMRRPRYHPSTTTPVSSTRIMNHQHEHGLAHRTSMRRSTDQRPCRHYGRRLDP
ncbi:hypothetical protein BC629DRAFT_304744 [Irpex lacteus]|nr:hypothetical protein BC629DRAFT_304744 [Irpex lacteus]